MNNRLYIVDTERNEKFLLAESNGGGWYLWSDEKELENWLAFSNEFAPRDTEASYGIANGKTVLTLMTETDERLPKDNEHRRSAFDSKSNDAEASG